MKRESRAYMHKDGFTFDSQDVVGPRGGEGVIVNLRRDENKRFRNGNSRFIFPRRFPLPLSLSLSLSLESVSNRTNEFHQFQQTDCFQLSKSCKYFAIRICISSLTPVRVCVDILHERMRKKKRKRERIVEREKFPHKLLTPRNDQLFPSFEGSVQLLGERRKDDRLPVYRVSFEKENRNYDSVVTTRLRHWEESVTRFEGEGGGGRGWLGGSPRTSLVSRRRDD